MAQRRSDIDHFSRPRFSVACATALASLDRLSILEPVIGTQVGYLAANAKPQRLCAVSSSDSVSLMPNDWGRTVPWPLRESGL